MQYAETLEGRACTLEFESGGFKGGRGGGEGTRCCSICGKLVRVSEGE
jgi:hypothetical protein